MSEKTLGWWYPTKAGEFHYFTHAGSLCGAFPSREVTHNPSPENRERLGRNQTGCAECVRLHAGRDE